MDPELRWRLIVAGGAVLILVLCAVVGWIADRR